MELKFHWNGGEVGIRFTWGFLGPYRPYAMTSSLCIVGDQSNCVVHTEISPCT